MFQVLMLGASDVGKSLLTSQFMSSNDVSTYNHDDQIGQLFSISAKAFLNRHLQMFVIS